MITSLSEVFFGLPTTPNFSFWRIIVYVLIWILASPVIWRVSESRGRLLKYWLSHHWNVISLKCSHIHTVFLTSKINHQNIFEIYDQKSISRVNSSTTGNPNSTAKMCSTSSMEFNFPQNLWKLYFPSTQTSVLHEVCGKKMYCRLIFWILHFPQHSMEFSFPHNLFMEKCTFHQIWITWSLWKKLYYRGILGEDSLLYTSIEWNFILDKDSLQILENLKMGNLYFTLILSLPYRQKL